MIQEVQALGQEDGGGVVARRGAPLTGDFWFKAADVSDFKGKDKCLVTTKTGALSKTVDIIPWSLQCLEASK
jgi:hypothetical protein